MSHQDSQRYYKEKHTGASDASPLNIAWRASSPVYIYVMNTTQHDALLLQHATGGQVPTTLENFSGMPASWVSQYDLQTGSVFLGLPQGQYYFLAGSNSRAILDSSSLTQQHQPESVWRQGCNGREKPNKEVQNIFSYEESGRNMESQPQPKEYTKKISFVNFFVGLFLIFSWFPEIVLFQAPIIAISLSLLTASVGVFLLSFSQFRIDRRYKHVTATQKDYLVLNIPFYLMALVPGLALLGFRYVLPKFGVLTAVYADGLLLVSFLFFARFPVALRLGQRAVPITDESVLSSFSGLANKMGVSHVDLYSIDWRKFKIANAFQAGPSKFSVFVSNYLLENMTNEEVNAVMAHELAHAKRKHVMKISGLVLFTSIIAIDLFVVAATLSQTSIWPLMPILAGFVVMFLGPQLVLRLQRKFELEADEIAVRTLGEGRPMVSALQKLVELNLVPADRKSGTHPSIAKRIQKIEQIGNMPHVQHNKIDDAMDR